MSSIFSPSFQEHIRTIVHRELDFKVTGWLVLAVTYTFLFLMADIGVSRQNEGETDT